MKIGFDDLPDVKAAGVRTTGRHDPCVGIRATPIAEAMVALVLMDHHLRHRAQNADVVPPTPTVPSSVGKARKSVKASLKHRDVKGDDT